MREHVRQTWDHIIAAYYRDQPPALRREVMPSRPALLLRTPWFLTVWLLTASASLLALGQQCAGTPSRVDGVVERYPMVER